MIVVGAGSAGCVVARVLAERGHTVLLLEAGEARGDLQVRRPARYLELFGSAIDWGHQTERQSGLAGRVLAQPRGRGPGGSSQLNAMIWMPPREEDLQRWHQLGGSAWSPVALRASLQQVTTWVRPEAPRWLSPSSERFLAAIPSLGVERLTHWRMNRRGVRTTAADVLRESPAVARVEHRVGLVSRLEIADQRVIGVRIDNGQGGEETVHAERGVVLCGGALASPAILQRSGIGKAESLRRLGIERRRDCPAVGANLMDHLAMPVIFTTRETSPFTMPTAPRDVARWQHAGSGPLTSNIAEVGGFAEVAVEARDQPTPMQFHVTPTDYLRFPGQVKRPAMTIAVTDTYPQSRGEVWITASDPRAPLRIDPGYLQATGDLETLLAGVRLARRLACETTLSEWLVAEQTPGSSRRDDEPLAAAVRRFAQTLYHPQGTCRFAGADQPTSHGVVASSLKLSGFDGCWIIDASVLPTPSAANPNATVMALGHHFASQCVSS